MMSKDDVKIVGLGGWVAVSSPSKAASKIALEGAARSGAETIILDIRELNLPIYDPAASVVPDSARRMREVVYEAQGLIWSSPMYHGTISDAFKNALDWLQLLSDHRPGRRFSPIKSWA
jgi:FMN reductase